MFRISIMFQMFSEGGVGCTSKLCPERGRGAIKGLGVKLAFTKLEANTLFKFELLVNSSVSYDLTFDATGYTWELMNCVQTANYLLTLR
ncbi:hypothetical protein L1987_02072 [Smallanthus sonchifolius]|uniref:Uncharacterized protein n=1 Tax=Smallanthus sonchifolius TaxID=185202 RepID=A0ACB9K6W9_9ASTR|nr:hypothetical protein L1987_02072 [Smallanthus sonchifolius]